MTSLRLWRCIFEKILLTFHQQWLIHLGSTKSISLRCWVLSILGSTKYFIWCNDRVSGFLQLGWNVGPVFKLESSVIMLIRVRVKKYIYQINLVTFIKNALVTLFSPSLITRMGADWIKRGNRVKSATLYLHRHGRATRHNKASHLDAACEARVFATS